ncbi:hypothetical protein GCM10009744_26370 [Kribbella alba]|uniref:ATP-dependent DNA ligase family profile domain-containing protein n=1 Tax=Kribbella alba TaxID=190197 RepID=A0ABN2F9S9_9ACTN
MVAQRQGLTAKFPDVQAALVAQLSADRVLDGELVVSAPALADPGLARCGARLLPRATLASSAS